MDLALEYDIEQEKQFDYRGLSMGEVVEHIAKFISSIWLYSLRRKDASAFMVLPQCFSKG